MQEQIDQLKNEIEQLKSALKLLSSSTTIPYDVGEAFKVRIGGNITASTPNSSIEAKYVNEAGTDAYNVSKVMDGLIPVNIEGNIYNIPYYN